MRLVLIRHGQTFSNCINALDTALPGADLDSVGRTQAVNLVKRLPDFVSGPVSALFSSPVARCQQTITPLAESLGMIPLIRPGVREIIAGDIEMQNSLEAIEIYLKHVLDWAGGKLDSRMPGAEDGYETRQRFLPVIEEAREAVGPEETAIIVSHGALIRVIAATLAPEFTVELVAAHPLQNTGTVVLESEGTTWKGITWNDRPIDEWEIPSGPAAVIPSKVISAGTLPTE